MLILDSDLSEVSP